MSVSRINILKGGLGAAGLLLVPADVLALGKGRPGTIAPCPPDCYTPPPYKNYSEEPVYKSSDKVFCGFNEPSNMAHGDTGSVYSGSLASVVVGSNYALTNTLKSGTFGNGTWTTSVPYPYGFANGKTYTLSAPNTSGLTVVTNAPTVTSTWTTVNPKLSWKLVVTDQGNNTASVVLYKSGAIVLDTYVYRNVSNNSLISKPREPMILSCAALSANALFAALFSAGCGTYGSYLAIFGPAGVAAWGLASGGFAMVSAGFGIWHGFQCGW